LHIIIILSLNIQTRLDFISTAELTAEELSLLRIPLESSALIGEIELKRMPKRGGRMYPFISLLLLTFYMEIRHSSYCGILKNITPQECGIFSLPTDGRGKFCIPSVGTLCNFYTKVLPQIVDELSEELNEAVLKTFPEKIITIDSTPL